jgi:sugar/nucleoside kinase (ribokinase family)
LLRNHTARTKALVVTGGKEGAALYLKKEKTVLNQKFSEIDKQEVAAIERNDMKDTTGCGDVFASGFFYKNAQNLHFDTLSAGFFRRNALYSSDNLFVSLNYANHIASINTSLEGVEELFKLKL